MLRILVMGDLRSLTKPMLNGDGFRFLPLVRLKQELFILFYLYAVSPFLTCPFLCTEKHDYNIVKHEEDVHLPQLEHDQLVVENQLFLSLD
jgi:hypothetical protein